METKTDKIVRHTPGPWETPGTDGGERVVCATVAGKRRTIAHVYAPYIDHDESGEERDANAHLITAAPDLLEACKLLADHFATMGPTIGDTYPAHKERIARAALRAAIKKATN
jgi:hypothetical protein